MIENEYPYFWLPFAIATLALWLITNPSFIRFVTRGIADEIESNEDEKQ